ncbi:hypothetical protein [Telluribacter sp.]|jgi:hypothetical protein|uniref:hypothetical protein n=1 Tax=Telluribacter sp. TaxID=1978767 RepID=UPI002E1258BB|nr:hypothetical protein [Telluribacter sp.]
MAEASAVKKFNFIIQAKGGVGKSFLTYLIAVKHEEDNGRTFIDVDSSTKTSTDQLRFLAHRDRRLAGIDLLDSYRKIARDRLFDSLQQLALLPNQTFYLDFGAPESEQIPALLTLDLDQDELKEFERYLNSEMAFHVVVAGGTAYTACMDYLMKIYKAVGCQFRIVIWINTNTFQTFPQQKEDLLGLASKCQLTVESFGDMEPNTELAHKIIRTMERGEGWDGIQSAGWFAKTKMEKMVRAISM